MNTDEIFENRRGIAKELLHTLRSSGRLGAARDLSAHPYCDGEKKYKLSMANYLRLAAASSSRYVVKLYDPRWYAMEDIQRNGWKLSDRARPTPLEVWRTGEDGNRECELVDFFHASDIEGHELLPKRETGLSSVLHDLQAKNILAASNRISFLDGLHAVNEYALHHGGNELCAAIVTQMWISESDIHVYFDARKELFTEALLDTIEKSPDELFLSARRAQDILRSLEQEPKKELSLPRDAPFSDLEVCYHWCETNVKDTSGEIYPAETVFKGEAAYEFLVQYNALDKRSFNEKIIGRSGYHKSGIEVRYKDYRHEEMRVDLGDLELGGRDSIADALVYRLDMYRRNLLEEGSEAKLRWAEIVAEGKNEGTYEDFLDAVRKESASFRERMEEFRQEESAYLEQRPELAKINQEKADTFLYTVRSEDFGKLPYGMKIAKAGEQIPERHLLRHPDFAVREYIASNFNAAPPPQTSKEQMAQAQLSSGSVVTFASGWQPSDISERMRRGDIPAVWLSISPEEQENLRKLEGFRLEISHEAPFGITGPKETKEYKGFFALRELGMELESEARDAELAVQDRFSLRRERRELSLLYDDEPLFHAAYESGKQELFGIINERGGILPDHLQEAVATICKYLPYESQPDMLLRRELPILEDFPSMEESRENYIKDCKDGSFPMESSYQAGNYYSIITLLRPEVSSADDFCKCMVEEMAKDGTTQNRMAKIIAATSLDKSVKEKMQEAVQSTETKSAIRRAKSQANSTADAR